jgi:hypothetical protein
MSGSFNVCACNGSSAAIASSNVEILFVTGL